MVEAGLGVRPWVAIAGLASALIYYLAVSQGAQTPAFNPGIAVAAALTAATALLLTLFSLLTGLRLIAALVFFYFAHFAMMQLEAWIFSLGSLDWENALGLLLVCLLFVLPFGLVSDRQRRIEAVPSSSSRPDALLLPTMIRICLAAALFPVVYFVAGITILPFVTEFYTGLIPPIHELMLWQLVRGFVFVFAALPLVMCFRGSRKMAMLVFVIVMPVVGGIAPLLLPNAAMPPEVRWVHGLEITASYVLYGAAIGYLLFSRGSSQGSQSPQVNASSDS